MATTTTVDPAPATTPVPAAATAASSPPASVPDGPSMTSVSAAPVTGAAGAPEGAPASAAVEKRMAESITTKSPSTTGAQASTSTADEKADQVKKPAAAPAPKPASPTPKSSPKKRRKRGGLTGLFVAMGCISSDEFDDDVKPKHPVKPNVASKNATKTPTANPANGSNGPTAAANDAPKTAAVATGAAAGVVTGAAATAAVADGKTAPDSNVVIPTHEPTTAPLDETAGLTSGAVQAPGSGSEIIHQHMLHHHNSSEHHLAADGATRTDSGGYTDLSDSDGDDVGHQEMLYEDEYEDEEDRLIAQGGIGIPLDENGNPAPLLPPIHEMDAGRKCLVLDLDETLLHSSFKMLPSADYIVPVEIESQTHNVYVIKRPGVDHFLAEMGKIYEIVVFTASLSKYADPVLDMLDVGRVVRHRLFRESCYNHKGNYVKDLSQLGRDMSTAIIIDNSPASYIFHPNNAVPVSTWFNDPHDTELTDLCPFLTDLATSDDVRGVLDGSI